jgi:hypothetical protein
MKTTLSERLLAAALLGSVLGAAGCASTSAQSEPTTPGASAEKASCKGTHGCKGNGTPGETAAGVEGDGSSAGGEKMSCKSGHGCNGTASPESSGGVPSGQ